MVCRAIELSSGAGPVVRSAGIRPPGESGKWILEAARIGIKNPHRIGIRDRLGNIFLNRVFRSERRVRVPGSASQVLPAADPEMPEVLAAWDETRRDLAVFLSRLEGEQMRQGIFRHPVAGWMTAPGIVAFFSVHITHHRFQLERLSLASREI